MKFFLSNGDARFNCGTTFPVYARDHKVWEFDGGRLVDFEEKYAIQTEPDDIVPPTVTPIEFKMLWTSAERVGIESIRTDDKNVADFMSLVESPKLTEVVMALQSVQDAILYTLGCLAAKAYIAPEEIETRNAQILSGVLR